MCRNTYILVFLFSTATLFAKTDYDFNEPCRSAYSEIFSLRIENGKQLLSEEKKQHPGNLIPVLLESYVDLLQIITSENASLLADFKARKNTRLNSLKNGNTGSPWHRYAQAEVQLHYALAAFQFQEYWSGLMDMRKAFFLLEENMRLHADFKPNQKSYYTIQALLGAVPEKYAWGLRLLGLQGNREKGMNGLQRILDEDWGADAFLRDEARHIYTHLVFHLENDKEKAWRATRQAGYPLQGNLFSHYTALKVALYSFQSDAALQLLETVPAGKEYAAFPLLKYYAGLAHLNKLETQQAESFFTQFLAERNSGNYMKSAHQKIAWCKFLTGDEQGYKEQLQLLHQTGALQIEADKQAQKEAADKLPPHPEILKARLLFDGGYFKQSLQTLENIPAESLSGKIYSLELTYRKARALHEMNDTLRAIESYMVTLGKGRNEPYYYAANAALNLALIYELKGNKELAKEYFNDCLSLDNHEYKQSLAQKAKAGLERLR